MPHLSSPWVVEATIFAATTLSITLTEYSDSNNSVSSSNGSISNTSSSSYCWYRNRCFCSVLLLYLTSVCLLVWTNNWVLLNFPGLWLSRPSPSRDLQSELQKTIRTGSSSVQKFDRSPYTQIGAHKSGRDNFEFMIVLWPKSPVD